MCTELAADSKTRSVTLRHSTPQAVEQYEAVKAREREQQEELDDARAMARAATLAFEELRQERTDLFMAAFQHVADTIDSVYTVRTQAR